MLKENLDGTYKLLIKPATLQVSRENSYGKNLAISIFLPLFRHAADLAILTAFKVVVDSTSNEPARSEIIACAGLATAIVFAANSVDMLASTIKAVTIEIK